MISWTLVALIALSADTGATAPSQPAVATASQAAEAKAGEKTVRALINAIRYKKDGMALSKLATRAMSELLLGPAIKDLSTQEQDQFVHDLEGMLAATSFVKGRDMFAYLDAVLFEPGQKVGNQLMLKSTVVVHRELKKIQIPLEWVLIQDGKQWRVVDIISMHESTAQAIREEEVIPLLQSGGAKKVLSTLHKRLADVAKKSS